MKKTSSLSALKLPREKPTMLSLLKKKRSFSEDSALVSQEIFKNSDSEILIRSRAQHTSFEEVSTITNQKFVLK